MAFCGECGAASSGGAFCTECGAQKQKIKETSIIQQTSFENKCQILADFYIEYKGEERFEDFYRYADLGLPLAYAFSAGIAVPKMTDPPPSPEFQASPAFGFIDECFTLLLGLFGIDTDTGFESLSDVTGITDDDDFI